MNRPIFFVRHGRYRLEELTEEGRNQSVEARETLLGNGVGRSALLLSSNAPRAVQTADILHEAIGERVIQSELIALAGFAPDAIEDLDSLLTEALESEGQSLEDHYGLVVVTHAPLVAAVKGPRVREEHIKYGEVVPYTIGSWEMPQSTI